MRVALQDGGWFDDTKAKKFCESKHFDGRNMVSDATGGQWDHEALYRTAKGKWVLNHWSQYQGSRDVYCVISTREAADWLVRNEYDEIPGELQGEVAATEV